MELTYYIPDEDRYVEGKVIVDKDATEVDLAALTDIPEGYTFAADFDENIAKQILRVKYGDTLDTLTIGIVETNQLTTADFSDGI